MKIVDIQVIPFRVQREQIHHGRFLSPREVTQTLTKVVTDEGAEGYYFGGHGHGDADGLPPGDRAVLEGRFKELVVGQDPYDRERFWHWMWVANIPEHLLSVLDMALWDLKARALGLPLYKLLGGCREKVKAYASTFPNMGSIEDYAAHALRMQGGGL